MSVSLEHKQTLLKQFNEQLEAVKKKNFSRDNQQKFIKNKFKALLEAAGLAAETCSLRIPSFRQLHLNSNKDFDLGEVKRAISRIDQLYFDIQGKINQEETNTFPPVNPPDFTDPKVDLELPPLTSYDQQIHLVVREGDLDCIKELMASGADLSVKDDEGYTPLHIAAERDDIEVLELLLAKELKEQRAHFIVKFINRILRFLHLKAELNSPINTFSSDNPPLTPLSYALSRGKLNVADLLLEAGAQINEGDFFRAAESGHLGIVETFLKDNTDIDAKNNENVTALHYAAFQGHLDIVEALLKAKANVEAKNIKGVTALHYAAFQGHLDIVEALLKAKANVEATNNSGDTSLILAASKRHLDVVEALLKAKANVEAKNIKGVTALHYAASKGHLDIVEALLKAKANIEATNNSGDTSLILAASKRHLDIVEALLKAEANIEAIDINEATALHFAAYKGHLDVVNVLLKAEANIEAKNIDEDTALHAAASEGHLDVVKALLKENANIEAKNNKNVTALHFAAKKGHLDVVKALLKEEANIEAANNEGDTALHFAASEGHLHVMEALLKEHANIEAVNNEGDTALHIATSAGHVHVMEALLKEHANIEAVTNEGDTALHFAAYEGHVDVVKALLKENANIEAANNEGDTALHFAASEGHLHVVKALLKENANIEAVNNEGDTALHFAASKGHLDIVEALLKAKANIEATSIAKETALHFAAKKGRLHVVEALLKAKANIEAVNNEGDTALHVAASEGHLDIVNVLLKAKANIEAVNNEGDTALHIATSAGHVHVMEALLKEKANIEAINHSGFTVLHIAAIDRQMDVLKALLKEKINIDASSKSGITALHFAATEGYLDVVEALLKAKADTEIRNKSGATALHFAVESEHVNVVKALLKANANIDASSESGATALHLAVKNGYVVIIKTLLEAKADVNNKNIDGDTALRLAVKLGHFDIVDLFLEKEDIDLDEESIPEKIKPQYEEIQLVRELLKKTPPNTDANRKALLLALEGKKYALNYLFKKHPELILSALEEDKRDLITQSLIRASIDKVGGVNISQMPKADEGSKLEDLELFKKYIFRDIEKEVLDNFIRVLVNQEDYIGFPKKVEDPSGFQKMHAEISNNAKVISIIAKELHEKVTEQTVLDFLKLRLEKQNLMKDQDKESEIYKEANQALIAAEKTLPFYERAFIGLQDSFFEQIKYCGTRWQSGLPIVFTEQKSITGLECFKKWKLAEGATEDSLSAEVIYKNIIYTYKFRKLEEVMRLILPLNNQGAINVHDESAYWRLIREAFYLSKDLGENDPLSRNRPKEELQPIREIFQDKVKVSELVDLIKERMDAEVKEKGVAHFSETKASESFTKLARKLVRGFKDLDTANFIAEALGVKVNEDAQSIDEYYTLSEEGASKAHIAILLRDWGIAC